MRMAPHNKPLHLTAAAPAHARASRLVYRGRACRRWAATLGRRRSHVQARSRRL